MCRGTPTITAERGKQGSQRRIPHCNASPCPPLHPAPSTHASPPSLYPPHPPTRSTERALSHAAAVTGDKALIRHLSSGLDDYPRVGKGLNTLGHRVDRVIHEAGLHPDQVVDGLQHTTAHKASSPCLRCSAKSCGGGCSPPPPSPPPPLPLPSPSTHTHTHLVCSIHRPSANG